MAQITYYAPAGVTSINLSDGSRAVVVNGQITVDSKFRNELETAGCTANAETDNAVRFTKTVTGVSKFSNKGLVIDYPLARRQLIITWGNSISANGFWSGLQYPRNSEIAYLMDIVGPSLEQKSIGGATSHSDACGNYGWAGQQLDAMTADCLSGWVSQLKTAGFIPDIILGAALVENDIIADLPLATVTGRIDNWIRTMFALYPNVKLVIPTPHPNTLLSTASKKTLFLGVRDYILALGNGTNIAVCDLSGPGSYANPADLTASLPLYAYNASSGNTSAPGTDEGPHPNSRGARVNARIYAPAIWSLIGTGIPPLGATFGSTNIALTGSSAQSGTGNSGTGPTGGSQAATLSDGSTYVGSAGNPGPWKATLVAGVGTPTGVAPLSSGSYYLRMSTSANLPVNPTGMFCKVKIVSGAANLSKLSGMMTPQGVSAALNTHANGSYDYPADYVDGEIVWLMTPMVAMTGLTSLYHDIYPRMAVPNAPCVLEILQTGWLESAP